MLYFLQLIIGKKQPAAKAIVNIPAIAATSGTNMMAGVTAA